MSNENDSNLMVSRNSKRLGSPHSSNSKVRKVAVAAAAAIQINPNDDMFGNLNER
jgi:hypothetical protein